MFDYRPHVYTGDHTILMDLTSGPAIFLDLRDPVCMAIYLTGGWEPWLESAFLSLVQPGMTVLDIGSHCGFFTLLAAKQAGPTGKVHAFEPNPFHHRNLLKSASLNGFTNVQLHRVMLSSVDGEETIETRGEGGTSIFHLNMLDINPVTHTTVRKAVLTDLLGDSKKVDVIKIDIDGGEPYIMDSLFEVIDANGKMTIFMEYLPMLWGGHAPRPIMQRFIDKGFAIFNMPMDGSATHPVSIDQLAAHSGTLHWDLLMMRG